MGKGSNSTILSSPSASPSQNNDDTTSTSKTLYSWDEVKKHNRKGDCWIVINDNVYNMSTFQSIHPGGSRIIGHYSGQDATEVFTAFHKDFERVNHFRRLYHIGHIDKTRSSEHDDQTNKEDTIRIENRKNEIRKDFRNLLKIAKDMKLFEPSYLFFFLQALQICFFQYMGYYILWHSNGDFIPFSIAIIFQIISQGQSDWTEHDYGHSSLFSAPKYNRIMQQFFLGTIKGASASWWNFMHNQHHAKPNVMNKDPDVRIDPIFVLGELEPKRKAEKNVKYNVKNMYPYTKQHIIFPIFAPLLFPVYFQIMTFRYAITRRCYSDLVSMFFFYLIHFGVSLPAVGVQKTIIFYVIMRLVESSWFTWVTQCNHIVMDIHEDDPTDTWLTMQLKATCNIEHSLFNDWFTGHLNFQIEHHLFPTMPRHNYIKIQPLVKSLCRKHNVRYVVKPLGQAFLDILTSLKKYGDVWEEAYSELQVSL